MLLEVQANGRSDWCVWSPLRLSINVRLDFVCFSNLSNPKWCEAAFWIIFSYNSALWESMAFFLLWCACRVGVGKPILFASHYVTLKKIGHTCAKLYCINLFEGWKFCLWTLKTTWGRRCLLGWTGLLSLCFLKWSSSIWRLLSITSKLQSLQYEQSLQNACRSKEIMQTTCRWDSSYFSSTIAYIFCCVACRFAIHALMHGSSRGIYNFPLNYTCKHLSS